MGRSPSRGRLALWSIAVSSGGRMSVSRLSFVNRPARERGGDALANPVGRRTDWVIGQMSVPTGGADVPVAEQLADEMKPFTAGQAGAREAVPEVMDPEIFHSGAFADAHPGPVEIGDRTFGIPPIRNDLDAPVREQALDQIQRRAPQANDLRPRLGVLQPEHPHGAVNLRPLEPGDLVFAGAGQRQEADDIDGRGSPPCFSSSARTSPSRASSAGERKRSRRLSL